MKYILAEIEFKKEQTKKSAHRKTKNYFLNRQKMQIYINPY